MRPWPTVPLSDAQALLCSVAGTNTETRVFAVQVINSVNPRLAVQYYVVKPVENRAIAALNFSSMHAGFPAESHHKNVVVFL
jgi:hypothetical protein